MKYTAYISIGNLVDHDDWGKGIVLDVSPWDMIGQNTGPRYMAKIMFQKGVKYTVVEGNEKITILAK